MRTVKLADGSTKYANSRKYQAGLGGRVMIIKSIDEAEVKQQAERLTGKPLTKGNGYCLIARRAYYTLNASGVPMFSVILHLGADFTELRAR